MLNFRPLPELNFKDNTPRFYRMGELAHCLDTDIDYLIKNLRVSIFLDLRSINECETNGKSNYALQQGLTWHHFPLAVDNPSFRRKKFPTGVDYYEYYVDLLETNQSTFLQIFQFIFRNRQNPISFGCYAGKDRTGVLAMLISLFYQVPHEILIHDYLESGKQLQHDIDYFAKNWNKKGLTRLEYSERLQPDAATAIALIGYLEVQYDGIIGYLNKIGLTQTELREHHENLMYYTSLHPELL